MSFVSVSERDAKILENDHYEPLSFERCSKIVEIDDMSLFTRSPQQLREYLAAKKEFEKYGGTAEYIIKYKLKWADNLESSGRGFLEDKSDIKILQNDFPYGLEPGIRHIIVWSKVRCATDDNQRPTAETKKTIEHFIKENIESLGVPRANIIWFKNTVALQSVPTLEHFHILIKDAPSQIDNLLGSSGL